MELWIRSQDKESLTKVKYINMSGNKEDKYYIWDYNTPLGKYKTRERALKVLDEIQRKIKFMYMFENCRLDKDSIIEEELSGTDFNIYEMPEE